jgi:hypothetical protein
MVVLRVGWMVASLVAEKADSMVEPMAAVMVV